MISVIPFQLESQEKTYTAKEALSIFKEGNYEEAEQAYASLLKRYSREVKYNYYYGICLLKNNNDIPQAVKCLKYSALKGVSRDVFYYLGRAYQLSYRFEEAISQYNRFLKYASASDIRNEKAERYKQECQVSKELSAKVYHLDVYSRDTVSYDDLLKAYHPVKDVGKIAYNSAFFESGLDQKGLLYLTERGDEVYFAMDNEQDGNDLYMMEKLLDGWSEKKALKGINTSANEFHPYVIIDGSILYFSSDREGGMGGYDLYKAIYDSESKTYTNPVNLGVPFNSPKDDYLFVADQFNSVAWFASNRETNDSALIVYNIRWNDSVVKSLVQDENELKRVAALMLSDEINTNSLQGNNKLKSNAAQKEKVLFHFMVADTLEYVQFENFKSSEAEAVFREGLKLVGVKDSLSDLMANKRERYAITNSDEERSLLVDNILSLEKQVYGLDEKIERNFFQTRSIEIAKVKQLVKEGRYSSSDQVKVKKPQASDTNILVPENFTFYTDQGFAQQKEKLEEMYIEVFNASDIQRLRHADSLFVWGNILTLESGKILEASNKPDEVESIIDVAFRNKDTAEEESAVVNQVHQAKELKLTALKLYHESLNLKYDVYSVKLKEVVYSNLIDDLTYIEEGLAESKAYFKEALELTKPINGFDLERFERAGAIKRSGVQVQEKSLFKYVEQKSGTSIKVEPDLPRNNVPKTYQELQGSAVSVEPAKVVEQAFAKPDDTKLVFKIQIGVFRNKPNETALNQIPPISKTEIPGRNLTKYFAGKYSDYSDAQNDLIKVREAGFNGAFVVVFKNGKQINLTEDLK